MQFFFLLILSISFNALGQDYFPNEEEEEKKRILEQYGDPDQYNESVNRDSRLKEIEEMDPVSLEELKAKEKRAFLDHLRKRKMGIVEEKENSINDAQQSDTNQNQLSPEQATKIKELTKQVLEERGMGESGTLNQNFVTNIMSDKLKQGLGEMIKTNPFSNMTKRDLSSSLVERTQGTAFGNFLSKNPKVLNILTEVCHDKEALPSFLSIVNRPKKMKYFSICVLIIFLTVFSLNLMNSKAGIFKRLLIKFSLMIIGSVANFSAFYIIFTEELEPIVDVILSSI